MRQDTRADLEAKPSRFRAARRHAAAAIGLLALGLATGLAAEAPPLPSQGDARHLGVATCAGSTCHGSARPLDATGVLQNEYLTWHRRDAHALAYEVLRDERSQRIAARLGLGPAEQADTCLDCHADNVAPARRGSRFQLADGVGCEACHGGAGAWIESHTQAEATHAGNVARGLYPTDRPEARTRLCLSCHYSHPDSPMTHRIMAAGHPPLLFEVDTFSHIQPAHYRVDADYRARKPAPGSARAWASGQIVAAGLMLDRLGRDLAGAGLFPELYHFDCNACHHDLQDAAWVRSLNPAGQPGAVPLEDTPLRMTGYVLGQLDAGLGRDWQRALDALHRATRNDAGAVAPALSKLRRLVAFGQGQLERDRLDRATLLGLMRRIARAADSRGFADRSWSDQSAMALGALLTTAAETDAVDGRRLARLKQALDRIYASLEDPHRYSPWRYREAVRAFDQALP